MKFSEVARRLTGISCPIFGISWDPGEAKVSSARRVLTYLEDRRVLYVPSEVEVPDHCVDSILDIRRFLTTELGHLDDKDEDIAPHLRAMRASCRAFLDRTATIDNAHGRFGQTPYGTQEWVFNQALGELRGEFGIHVAQLSAKFGIDIEDQLAVILPGEVEDAEDESDGWGRHRYGRR